MTKPVKLVLLYGGRSGEHEISLISAAAVLANLDSKLYEIIPVGIDKEGCFFANNYNELLAYTNSLPVKIDSSIPLPSLLVDGKLFNNADVVFPMVHGPLYEDGCLQGLLALADVAIVGSNVMSSAVSMDKDMTRQILSLYGVKSTRYKSYTWADESPDLLNQYCKNLADDLGWPLFVKPCSLGSSVGIHKVNNIDELVAAIKDARRYDTEVLIEAAIEGREIELAVLENPKSSQEPFVSIPGEIKINHVDGFYSYAAKYIESDCSELIIPAPLDKSVIIKLQKQASDIFRALKCRGMARVDFFVNDTTKEIYFNEINTLPGFTPISMYPRLMQAGGLSYSELLDQLVDIAMLHHQNYKNLVRNYS